MDSPTVILSDVKACREALVEVLEGAKRILPFTGAGISTDAGIPDFRSPGSLWTANKPIPFDIFCAHKEARIEAWRRKFNMDDRFAGARPTPTHHLLTSWVKQGRAQAVITQNIDGLHHAAGLNEDEVIELHGNGTYAKCLNCGCRHELADVRKHFLTYSVPPECESCGGIVKSATISFGQAMPGEAMARARHLAKSCDVCLVIGSSLVVYPAASLPLVAKAAGARLVIVNREETGLDEDADLVLRGEVADLMSPT